MALVDFGTNSINTVDTSVDGPAKTVEETLQEAVTALVTALERFDECMGADKATDGSQLMPVGVSANAREVLSLAYQLRDRATHLNERYGRL